MPTNLNKLSNKKINSQPSWYLITGVSFFLGFIILITYYLITVQSKPVNKLAQITPSPSQPSKQISQKNFPSHVVPQLQKKVWQNQDYNENEVNLPSLEQAHQIFLNIRQAAQKRDYELFKQYASVETIWNTQHNLETIGLSEDGQHYVKKITTKDGKDYFKKYAPGIMPYQIPTNNDLFLPQKINWSKLEKKTDDIIIGEDTDSYLAIREQWDYVASISYRLNLSSNKTL